MDTFTLLIVCTALYLIGCAVIGIYTSRVKVTKPSDFFLAGHALGPIVLSLAMMATVFSAWFILGHQGLTWQLGFPYIAHYAHIPLMAMLGLLIFGRQWAVGKRNGFITPSEMYGTYYDSELIRILVVIIAALYAIPYVALQLRGAGYVFNTLSGGKIDPTTGAVVLGVVVILYVFLGGLKAAAITDTIQGILLYLGGALLAITAVMILSNMSQGSGVVAQWYKGIVAQGNSYITIPETGKIWSWPYILTIAIATAGIYTSPSYTMLTFAASSPKIFKFQAFFIMALAMGFMYYIFSPLIGVGGKSIITKLANSDALTLELIFNHMSPWMFVVTALGILAAMNSTAAGYLANTSTILARDVYCRYINPDASPQRQVLMGRLMVLVIVLLAVIFSVSVLDYLVLLGTLATAFGMLMLPAILGVTYLPRITRAGVTAGLICGMIAVFLTYFYWRHPLGIHTGGWGLIVNSIVCFVVSSYTEKPSLERIKQTHGIWDKAVIEKITVSNKQKSIQA
ncbi:MAG: sodium:solute symporter [Peptococcaceae bacterium]|jgi:Na+/proline symporter|nr:sodium:solute symporter [Peptococcaceae bacterium]